MKIVSSKNGNVVFEHVGRNGEAKSLSVRVDNESLKFIKSNASSIRYDSTNDAIRYVGNGVHTSLARAICMNINPDLDAGKNIQFADGNKFNLKTSNFEISE